MSWRERWRPPFARAFPSLLGLIALCLVTACPGDATVSSDGAMGDGPSPRDAVADQRAADIAADQRIDDQGPPGPDLIGPDLVATKPTVDVVLLAGQSNMVGLGINSQLSAADKAPVSKVSIYYNPSVHPNTNGKKWLPLGPGFGVTAAHFGPELALGRRLHQLWPQRTIALIKVAEGGTALQDRWLAQSGDLYKLLIAETQAQLAVLKTQHPGHQLRVLALVWMQGESDAFVATHANAYQQRFAAFVDAVRADLSLPMLPVIAGLIAPQGGWPLATTVRDATRAVSVLRTPMEVVETNDLPMFATDVAHYNSASNLILGRRFADAVAAAHATRWSFPADFGDNQYNHGWSYRDRAGATSTPMTWVRAKQRWEGSQPALLIAGKGLVHPGGSHEAELRWTAPRAGSYTLTVNAEAGDGGGGDGSVVTVYHDNVPIWGPTPIPNGAKEGHTATVSVAPGTLLSFRCGSGPAQDNSYDTTLLSVSITP